MKKVQFLKEIQDILLRDKPCIETDILSEYEEWDSLAKLSIMAFFGRVLKIEADMKYFKDVKTVGDLVNLAKDKLED